MENELINKKKLKIVKSKSQNKRKYKQNIKVSAGEKRMSSIHYLTDLSNFFLIN